MLATGSATKTESVNATDLAPTPSTNLCLDAALLREHTRVEEVAVRFVIHFVSVYSIIHPGVRRASCGPDTACDRVQTAIGLKYT